MDVLLTIAMLGLMAAAIAVLGRGWPRSSRGGGYRAGRGYGAADRDAAPGGPPPVPEDDDARWRWASEPPSRDAAAPDGGGSRAMATAPDWAAHAPMDPAAGAPPAGGPAGPGTPQ